MHARTFRHSQRGYTLMEILVAVAIFATVMIVALLLYDQSNRVFKQSTESAEMQQNTRVAFEKVVSDLRMAGFDYKRAGTPVGGNPLPWAKEREYSSGTLVTADPPDGHVYRAITSGTSGTVQPAWKTGAGAVTKDEPPLEWIESGAPVYEQPDEQIEYAHKAAITIRANFDYDDPNTPDRGREKDLEDSSEGHFPIVTTGNDEIVTYALVSRSGNANANKDTISFFADMNEEGQPPSRKAFPGGKAEREIKITGVDLTNQYPPYTLMRYTWDEKGVLKQTALADNIRSMNFKYYQDSAAKNELTDFDDKVITDFSTLAGLGKYDPAKPADLIKERMIRGKIRAVTATIVGMNPQPDFAYTNPTDTVAPNYRQYTLQSTIVGRNLGLKGMPQTDTNPPGPPTIKNACTGYCGVAILTWAPAPNTGDVTYTVLYDTSPSGSFSGVIPAGTQTSFAVDLTQLDLTKTYYFRVAATNEAGTTMSTGNPLALDLRNATKPHPPMNVQAASTAANSIDVTWTIPGADKGNANGVNPSCTDGEVNVANVAAETKGYRVYRSKDPDFEPAKGEGTLVLDETKSGKLVATGGGGFRFTDSPVANCEKYYYRVATVEWCAAKAEYNKGGDAATAVSDYSLPSNEAESKSTIKPKAATNFKKHVSSVCDPLENRCDPVTLVWDPVTQDVEKNEIVIERYTVYRQTKLKGVNVGTEVKVGSTEDGVRTITDNEKLLHHDPADEAAEYSYEYRLVATQCGVEGEPATYVYPGACVTGATIVPDADGPGSGTLDDPMENVNSLTVQEYPSKPIKQVRVAVDGPPFTQLDPPYNVDWDIQDGEIHRVVFEVTTVDAADEVCTEFLSFFVQADPADCALRTGVSQVVGNNNRLKVTLTNITADDIQLDTFDIAWAGQTGFAWNTVTLPSGASLTATATLPQTAASARTVTFTPDPAKPQDRLIPAGKTYTLFMNFTSATGFIRPSSVGGVRADYHQVGETTQFGCTTQLSSCAVAATVAVTPATGSQIFVSVKNNSAETLSVTQFTIAWAGQTDWQWISTTAENTMTLAAPSNGSTETFKPVGMQIPPQSTFVIAMNMQTTKKSGNPPNLNANAVGDVYLEYTTQTTVTGVLTCRAKP